MYVNVFPFAIIIVIGVAYIEEMLGPECLSIAVNHIAFIACDAAGGARVSLAVTDMAAIACDPAPWKW